MDAPPQAPCAQDLCLILRILPACLPACLPARPPNRYSPYATGKVHKCKICKSTLHQEGIYCHNCAYSKG
jgi:hypothetical protein